MSSGVGAEAVRRALDALGPLGGKVVPNADLGAMTTYRVGGPALILVTASSVADLLVVAAAVRSSGMDVLVVGRGSNLLVSDRGFPGLAVCLDPAAFGAVSIEGQLVQAGAAVALPVLARQTVDAGLTGLEWAVGVPGSVGGGIRMNAGGHGSDMAQSMSSCQIVDLAGAGPGPEVRSRASMDYTYRHSSVGPLEVVVAATFELAPGDPDVGRETIREIVRWRRDHQPGGQNAGSVFTNPPGDSAGRIIDSAGLKGRRYKTAVVSSKHANFIQADPDGSADDVYELIRQVQAEVANIHGIQLQTEVRTIGFGAEPSTGGRGLGRNGGAG